MERLIAALTDLIVEATLYIREKRGVVAEKEEAPSAPKEEKSVRRKRKPRAEKKEEAPAADNPFNVPMTAPTEGKVKASVEEQLEAKRRSLEVVGLFVRKHIQSQPPGLARAKTILAEVTPRYRDGMKLEELTYDDHRAIVTRFEKELEAAA